MILNQNRERPTFARLRYLIPEDVDPFTVRAILIIKNKKLYRYEISQDEKYIYKYITQDEYERWADNFMMTELGFECELDKDYFNNQKK